jgi:extracellular factor (EF) 3-hydroxypalmitic acid methyl ester biosynthesis protein
VNKLAETVLGLERAAGASRSRLSREYRDVVDGTVDMLERHRTATTRQEEATISQVVAGLWDEWRTLWSDAAECLADIGGTPGQLAAAKEYTESELTPILTCAPLWRQAYAKPRGYPGDYLVMEHIYDGSPRGETPFARVAHVLGIQIGQFVVRRKDLVRDALAAAVAQRRCGESIRIVSLGCGPARELVELPSAIGDESPNVSFVLVDQDGGALKFAGGAIARALRDGDAPTRIAIEPRQTSVLRMLREVAPAELFGEADMIYSAGLFDYFSDRSCRVLARRLYDALRPGGIMMLGNMKVGTDMVWPLELIADWSLTYRSADDVLEWAGGLAGAEISLRTEATGYDYILGVHKPA